MNTKRGILSIILVIGMCLTLSLPIPAGAEQSLTTEEKGDVLNQLTILAGNGSGYNLDAELKRCEAAVFVVRTMGKAAYVLTNKEQYWATKFPDVISTQWYAPYIGYCIDNNIISGSNGRFAPNDNIQEQAFLKLMLASLGYEDGADFTWNTVYEKAYEIGLISGEIFEGKNAQNKKFTRGNVVDILYASLKLENIIANLTLIQNLISEGVVTKEKAIELGIIEDGLAAQIEGINVLNQNWISIRLNKTIDKITMDDIKIYETNDFTKSLTSSITSQTTNEIILQTSNQKSEMSYTVELSNIVDRYGNISDTLSSTFTGYRNPNLISDFFKINRIEPINSNVINLYFTHPVNANSEIASYYEIVEGDSTFASGSDQDMTIKLMKSANNGVSIYLKGKSFTKDKDYKLQVSGDLTSSYGVELDEGEGESISFKGREDQSEDFSVVAVTALGSNRVSIEFSQEIDSNFAQKFINYSVTGPYNFSIPVTKAVIGGDGSKMGRVVFLSLMYPLDRSKQYVLRFEYITDIFKQSELEGREYSFSGAYPANTALGVIQTWSEDNGTVYIRFNSQLDASIATNRIYYSIRGVTDQTFYIMPEKVYYDESNGQYTAKLYIQNDRLMTSASRYKVTVLRGMKDIFGDAAPVDLEAIFTASNNDSAKPVMSRALIISKEAIKVSLNKEIAGELPNLLPSNYVLEYKVNGYSIAKIPTSVTYVDSKTLILKFSALSTEPAYTLRFDTLKDYFGLNIRTSADGQNSIGVTVGQ